MALPELARLLAFDDQYSRDRDQAPLFLHRRDRRYALNTTMSGDDAEQNPALNVDHWLQSMGASTASRTSAARSPTVKDHRIARWRRLHGIFIAVGAGLGLLSMASLLFYNGGVQINLTVLLAFMALQLFLTGFTVVQSVVGWRPWAWLAPANTRAQTQTDYLGALQPAQMARVAQSGGLSFALSGLLTLLVLVTVQDLAFGWSTTLETSAQAYYRLTAAIAWPWQSVWPAAVPDLALVQDTRFFRLGSDTTVDGSRWGEWWPFVAMAWFTYVVIPRLVARVFASLWLRHRCRILLARHPGMLALKDRMRTPVVETGTASDTAQSQPLDNQTAFSARPSAQPHLRLLWAGASSDIVDPQSTVREFALGGEASLEEDQRAIDEGAEILGRQARPVVEILVNAWEPATAELEDCLILCRESWPAQSHLYLCATGIAADRPPTVAQLAQWHRFCQRSHARVELVAQNQLTTGEPS